MKGHGVAIPADTHPASLLFVKRCESARALQGGGRDRNIANGSRDRIHITFGIVVVFVKCAIGLKHFGNQVSPGLLQYTIAIQDLRSRQGHRLQFGSGQSPQIDHTYLAKRYRFQSLALGPLIARRELDLDQVLLGFFITIC